MSPQTMIRPNKRNLTTVAYELTTGGELLPYRRRVALGMPLRPGRKSPTEAFANEQRHHAAAQKLRERMARGEPILPPPEMTSLPLIASLLLYVSGVDLRTKLTAATWQLHRKLVRQLTDLDISMPLSKSDNSKRNHSERGTHEQDHR
ncbi:MAG: hypothetical protein RL173_38 [Fibrobacterota bacterium]|jgi:hypothetical protein